MTMNRVSDFFPDDAFRCDEGEKKKMTTTMKKQTSLRDRSTVTVSVPNAMTPDSAAQRDRIGL